MKPGDILICKIELDGYICLTKGNSYKITDINYDFPIYIEIKDDCNDYEDVSLYLEYFYTKEEIRKLKLESL